MERHSPRIRYNLKHHLHFCHFDEREHSIFPSIAISGVEKKMRTIIYKTFAESKIGEERKKL